MHGKRGDLIHAIASAQVSRLQQWIDDQRLLAVVTAQRKAVTPRRRINGVSDLHRGLPAIDRLVGDRRGKRDIAFAGTHDQAAIVAQRDPVRAADFELNP